MTKIYKDYKYFLSSAVNLDVMVLISSIELASLDPTMDDNIPRYLQQQIGSPSKLRSSTQSGFYITAQIFSDGIAMHSMPISTSNRPRCNGSTIVWDEWVTLPVKYRELPRNSQLALTIWAVGNLPVGGTTIRFFNDRNVLRDGLQKLGIFPKVEADGSIYSTTNGDCLGDDECFRLEKLREKYDRKHMPHIEWLDFITFQRMATISCSSEPPTPNDSLELFCRLRNAHPSLSIQLPYFGNHVLYEEDPYGFRGLSYPSDPKIYAEGIQRSNTDSLVVNSSPAFQLAGSMLVPYGNSSMNSHSMNSHSMNSHSIHSHTMMNSSHHSSHSSHSSDFTYSNAATIAEQVLLVYDPELDEDNPVEMKYRKLAKDSLRGEIDPNLKPNREELTRIERILSHPNDQLTNDEKDLLWKFRYILVENKKAVTKFLLSVDWNDEQEVKQATDLLAQWVPIDIADALKLLGREKEFKNDVVRRFAVATLSKARDEELQDYLLQLVQALRYEPGVSRVCGIDPNETIASGGATMNTTNNDYIHPNLTNVSISHAAASSLGPLARFLISRASRTFQLANYFYWYLKVELDDPTHGHMYRVVYKALIFEMQKRPESRSIYEMLAIQDDFMAKIALCQRQARDEKGKKDQKEERLRQYLREIKWPKNLIIRMPLDPSVHLTNLVPTSASMFKSAMYPALIEFKTSGTPSHTEDLMDTTMTNPSVSSTSSSSSSNLHDPRMTSTFQQQQQLKSFSSKSVARMSQLFGRDEGPTYKVMFKNGDDLRQDQLIMQMFILMDRLLKRVNLDLKLTPYRILATSTTDGLMEFVLNSRPVSSVVAGFESPQILNFLRKYHPDANDEFGVTPEAMGTYIKSVAGYCVLTYLLGIGDRHLDNLMLKTEGHLFHIDFGYIFGRDPKPYPPPFKLTKEMVEGMGGPESVHYTKFKTYCCQAYNWLRRSASLILNLLSLMVDAGIEDLSADPVTALAKVQEKFRLDLTDEQAEQFFLGLINDSVTALFPVLMEYIHKMATRLRP